MYHGYIFTVLNICVYPSRWPTRYVKTCLIKLFNVGLFLLYIQTQSPPAFGGDHSISTELLQAAWPLSSTKSAWIRALENLHGFFFFSFSLFFSSFFFVRISLFFISSSSSRPYQYITVVFRNSLPSATEDTQEPRISQQLTSCWRKCTIQDVIVDETLTSKCCPLVFQFQQCYYGFRNRFKGEIRIATMTNVIKNHLLHHMQQIYIIHWRILMVSGRKKIKTNQHTFSCVFKIIHYTSQYISI